MNPDMCSWARCDGKAEEPEVVAKILSHLQTTAPDQYPPRVVAGAPPDQGGYFELMRGLPMVADAVRAGDLAGQVKRKAA